MSFTYNVRDTVYGAAGDGTTDDSEAIQDAINAAKDAASTVYNGDDGGAAEGVGGIVFVPKGTYLTTRPLYVPATVVLQGEGPGSLIKSIFDTEQPAEFDAWNGAIEMTPDSNQYVRQEGVRNLCIFTNNHCGITYDRSKEVWPAYVFTYQNSAFSDVTSTNNDLFQAGQYAALTGTSDYLYIAFTNKADFIPNTGQAGANGLLWTRMKQLGFKDQWGSRLDLTWEYASSTETQQGPVTVWTAFPSGGSDLGAGFWRYGHNGLYATDFGASWILGTVNGSDPKYWIRVKTTSTVAQQPIAHHVYPGIRAIVNMCTFQDLYFNCGNWAIFFGLFTYCQHNTFRRIRTVRNGGGCIWNVGNSNYISECDTEGGTRDDADIGAVTDPGQFVMEGDGNSIEDVIAEGGGTGSFPWYCFRGDNLTASNLWVEHRGPDTVERDRVDCFVQESLGARFDRPAGRMRFENARNIVIDQATTAPDLALSDLLTIVGDSSVVVHDLWGYQHPGDMDNSRIRWNNFHSFSNRGQPLLSNVTNPVTGNLVPNGDFQNGTFGWTLTTNSGTSTGAQHGTIVSAPNGRGKELVVDITGDNNQGVFIDTTLNIPPGHEGNDAFLSFRADTDGNCRYERRIIENGVQPVNLFSSLLNSQTAYRIRRIGFDGTSQNSTHLLRLRAVTTEGSFDSAFKYDGSAFSELELADTILEAMGHQLYLGTDLPVSAFDFTVSVESSVIEFSVEYWDGSQWREADDLNDGTAGFERTGMVAFSTSRDEASRPKRRTLNGVGPLFWIRLTATGTVATAPEISTIAKSRRGKFYLSNVSCVIGQIHNQVPAMQSQRRWPDGRVELTGSTTPPTTGTWRVGDIIWNASPSPSGSIGIVCTSAGTGAGATWKTFGSIAS